jgi:hypothetical protein
MRTNRLRLSLLAVLAIACVACSPVRSSQPRTKFDPSSLDNLPVLRFNKMGDDDKPVVEGLHPLREQEGESPETQDVSGG